MTTATDPASYTIDGTGALKCRDCGRCARDKSSTTLTHARNCAVTGLPRDKIAGPVTAQQAADTAELVRLRSMAAAVKRGEAGQLDDADVQNLVRAGLVSMSSAMNSDF